MKIYLTSSSWLKWMVLTATIPTDSFHRIDTFGNGHSAMISNAQITSKQNEIFKLHVSTRFISWIQKEGTFENFNLRLFLDSEGCLVDPAANDGKRYYQSDSGTLQYPKPGFDRYGNNKKCIWSIKTNKYASALKIKFDDVDIEFDKYCGKHDSPWPPRGLTSANDSEI